MHLANVHAKHILAILIYIDVKTEEPVRQTETSTESQKHDRRKEKMCERPRIKDKVTFISISSLTHCWPIKTDFVREVSCTLFPEKE